MLTKGLIMNVVIFRPRLDIAFKQTNYVPPNINYASLPPIRQAWLRFTELISAHYASWGDSVNIVDIPLWKLTPQVVDAYEADLVLVPHRSTRNFNPQTPTVFYMQMALPQVFSVDHNGWCVDASYYPLHTPKDYQPSRASLMILNDYVKNGQGKFTQPPRENLSSQQWGQYALFACQLPHDTSIEQGEISVYDALEQFLEQCDVTPVVKGHPANPNSMKDLKQLTKFHGAVWVDDKNIVDLILGSRYVSAVNSGTGIEAAILGKCVKPLGKCEYQSIAGVYDQTQLQKFVSYWYSHMIDINVPNFRPLKEATTNAFIKTSFSS